MSDRDRKLLDAMRSGRNRLAHNRHLPGEGGAPKDPALLAVELQRLSEGIHVLSTRLHDEAPPLGPDEYHLLIDGRYYKYASDDPNEEEIVEVDSHKIPPLPPLPPLPPTPPAVSRSKGVRHDIENLLAIVKMTLVSMSVARTVDHRRATGVLDALSKIVPKRIAQEEIGDAIEVINTSDLKRWQVWLKVIVTIFFVLVNTVREISASLLGKKKGGS